MGRQVTSYGFRRFIRMLDAAQAPDDPKRLQHFLLQRVSDALWFEDVRFHLRATTAHDVGKMLFPDRYQKETELADGRDDRRVERYATGESRVMKAYREAAKEKITKRFTRQNVQALIEALDISRPVGDRANTLLRTTCPEVQKAIFKRPIRSIRLSPARICRLLGAYACTESVAALTILLREAIEQGDTDAIFLFGETLYYMTLVWCMRAPIHEAHREVGLYLCLYIFPLVRDGGLAFSVSLSDYFNSVECLKTYVFQWNHFPFEMRMALFDDLFRDWSSIWEMEVYRFGLAPRLCLIDPESASRDEWLRSACRLILKTWGWRVLRLVEPDVLPPESIYQLLMKDPQTLMESDIDGIETENDGYLPLEWMRSPLRGRREQSAAVASRKVRASRHPRS